MSRIHHQREDGVLIAFGYENILGPEYFLQVFMTEEEVDAVNGDTDGIAENYSTLALTGEIRVTKDELIDKLLSMGVSEDILSEISW
jgi:hypothetical protein